MEIDVDQLAEITHKRDLIGLKILVGKRASVTDAMTAKEVARYSFCNLIDGLAKRDFKKCGFEMEVSDETARNEKRETRGPGWACMPSTLPFQVKDAPVSPMTRAIYQVGTAAQGGNLVGTELMSSDFIEVLRNRTLIGQLGARFLSGLVGNVDIPRQNAQTNTFWVGESAALTESEATFDKVALRPRTVGSISKIGRTMILQATPAIEQLVREDLVRVNAIAVDAAALYGTGTGAQPAGILNSAGIAAVIGGANGAAATFDMMVQLYAAPLVANAPQSNMAFALNGKTRAYLSTLKSTTGQYLWNPTQSMAAQAPGSLVGYNYAVSNQLPSNLVKGTSGAVCSAAIFGNWQELLIGEWGVNEIMVNPYDSTGFANGDVVVRSLQTIDVGLRHPASFSAITDLLTTGF